MKISIEFNSEQTYLRGITHKSKFNSILSQRLNDVFSQTMLTFCLIVSIFLDWKKSFFSWLWLVVLCVCMYLNGLCFCKSVVYQKLRLVIVKRAKIYMSFSIRLFLVFFSNFFLSFHSNFMCLYFNLLVKSSYYFCVKTVRWPKFISKINNKFPAKI